MLPGAYWGRRHGTGCRLRNSYLPDITMRGKAMRAIKILRTASTPFLLAWTALLTGILSFVLAQVLPLPLWWDWTGFDTHHHFAFPVLAWLGYEVPAAMVVLAVFLAVFGTMSLPGKES